MPSTSGGLYNPTTAPSDGFHVTGYIDKGVQYVKLISGEDMVGHLFIGEDDVRIERPINIFIQGPKIGIAPWRPFLAKEATIAIRREHIIFWTDIVEDLEVAYRNATSDIQLAAGSIPAGPAGGTIKLG